jgi:hypothetical protein
LTKGAWLSDPSATNELDSASEAVNGP